MNRRPPSVALFKAPGDSSEEDASDPYVSVLEASGRLESVTLVPVLQFDFVNPEALAEALHGDADGLVLTSPRAAEAVLRVGIKSQPYLTFCSKIPLNFLKSKDKVVTLVLTC